MLSRVAESLYWMARYIERAENTARIISVNTMLLLDLPADLRRGWKPVIEILGCMDNYLELHDDFDERTVLKYLVSEQGSKNSIVFAVAAARENARTIRDIIPREVWEVVNNMYHTTRSNAASGYSRSGRYEYLTNLKRNAQAITGLFAGCMMHDQGYDFMRMGRNLERGEMTTRIIDVHSAEHTAGLEQLKPFENIQWVSVLRSLTAYQMYRRTIQDRVSRADVLRFLLTDEAFPRSYHHTLLEVRACLKHLPRHRAVLTELDDITEQLLKADIDKLEQDRLQTFIDDLQLGSAKIHERIGETYFLNQ